MHEICSFYNIIIQMFFDDKSKHYKPHFHVRFAEYEALIGVDGELISGNLPIKQLRIVQGWAALHEDELYRAWNNAVRNLPIDKIEPLK